MYNWLHPGLLVERRADGQRGVVSKQPIAAGELLVVWGGRVVDSQGLGQIPQDRRVYALQLEESLYLVPADRLEPADYVNHSCDPNAGLSGQITLVALRAISVGDEICFDYAMSDGSPYDEFDCSCGTSRCRGRVSGDDWRRPELQQRYANYFSPYLARRIATLRQRDESPKARGVPLS